MRDFLSLRVAVVVMTLALGACATDGTPPPAPPGSVRIAPDMVLALPKPSELGRSVEASQLVTAHYGERNFVFEGHISATPERFLLVGLDPMGRRVISVTWTDQGFTTETAPWLPDQLRPDNMLAVIALLYWPPPVLDRALSPSGGRIEVGPHSRSVVRDGKEVMHADYAGDDPWNGSLTFRNLSWGYGLDVQSVEAGR